MKTISKIFAVTLCMFSSMLSAIGKEGSPEVGFLRIINAIAPGNGTTRVLIDGEDLFPKGYQLGQRSGGIGLAAGSHTVTLQKNGVEIGTTKIDLKSGETLSLIGFAEKIPATDDHAPPRWTTKILKLKQSDPERGFRMTLLSVCDLEEVKVDAMIPGNKDITAAHVKRLSTAVIDLGSTRSEAMVKVGGEIVTTVSPDEPGNHVVVLYQDAEGKVRALTFFDPKFVIAG
ncbi:MAG: hypothetical protein KGQ87_05260 [Verrucomicrobia bacterium]|nr:hypothetical protein [Verrucomicrobiota bacterium]